MADPLFVGPTRPAMKWGIPLDGIVVGAALASIALIGSGNPLTLLIYAPIHIVLYILCLKDPRILRLIGLWVSTKGKSLGWKHWGAATAAPIANPRLKRKMPE